jgi:hypothetical protein
LRNDKQNVRSNDDTTKTMTMTMTTTTEKERVQAMGTFLDLFRRRNDAERTTAFVLRRWRTRNFIGLP